MSDLLTTEHVSTRIQEKQSVNLKDYTNRVLVTGLPGCITNEQFRMDMCSYVNNLNEDVIFLSIGSREGPEEWIVEWCRDFKYPCFIIDEQRTLDNFERVDKACIFASNLLMFTTRNSEFKLMIDRAKIHKTMVTKVITNEQ